MNDYINRGKSQKNGKNQKNRNYKNKKNKGGRPKLYNDDEVEKMQKKINDYFLSCTVVKRNIHGEPLIDPTTLQFERTQVRPYTVSGLADALGMTRQSLLNYEKNNKFFDTITRARRKCEIYAEERLYTSDGNRGARFSLMNNFGWKEKVENVNVGTTYDEYIKKVADKDEY